MKGRLFYLFVSLLTLVVLSPFLLSGSLGKIILYVLPMAAGISTVYGLRLGRRPMIITLSLGVLSVALGTASVFVEGLSVHGVATLCTAVFYGFLIGLLVRYIVRAEKVTADILFGSVSVYLLIGISFSIIYRFIGILNPAAFTVTAGAPVASATSQMSFTYYSFVTLTTLGYGDIVPLSSYARTFAFLEAITGVLYVAILISRLVGLYITNSIMKKNA
jgi:hypothetical protein